MLYKYTKYNPCTYRLIDHYEHHIIIEKHEHQIVFPNNHMDDKIFEWCNEIIGNFCTPFNKTRSFACSSRHSDPFYVFTSYDDALLFKVTWE